MKGKILCLSPTEAPRDKRWPREPACLGSELHWGRDRSCWTSRPPCAHGVCTVCEQVMEMEPGEGSRSGPAVALLRRGPFSRRATPCA